MANQVDNDDGKSDATTMRIPRAVIEGLERTLTRVPVEEAKRLARQTQRVLEKEWKPLRAGSDKLVAVKAKVLALREAELGQLELAIRRQVYLDGVLGAEDLEVEGRRWLDTKYYRLLADYLARLGRFSEARQLVDHLQIADLADIAIIEQWHRVMETLRLKRTTETLQWCSENRNHLRKQGSALEWHLRRQDFVELLRRGDKAAAVLYAKKHFGALLASSTAEHDNAIPGNDDNAQHQHEGVPQALALLVAARPAYWPPPYSALMREDRAWQRLQDAFTDLFFSMYGLPRDSILPALVQCGCAAFKSPACRPGGHPDCPSCAPALESLVRPLPYAHYEYSRLLCRMSGAVMNEDNPPMALPNGQIYSLKSLEEMQRQRGGWVECPETKDVYRFDQLKKCFIL